MYVQMLDIHISKIWGKIGYFDIFKNVTIFFNPVMNVCCVMVGG